MAVRCGRGWRIAAPGRRYARGGRFSVSAGPAATAGQPRRRRRRRPPAGCTPCLAGMGIILETPTPPKIAPFPIRLAPETEILLRTVESNFIKRTVDTLWSQRHNVTTAESAKSLRVLLCCALRLVFHANKKRPSAAATTSQAVKSIKSQKQQPSRGRPAGRQPARGRPHALLGPGAPAGSDCSRLPPPTAATKHQPPQLWQPVLHSPAAGQAASQAGPRQPPAERAGMRGHIMIMATALLATLDGTSGFFDRMPSSHFQHRPHHHFQPWGHDIPGAMGRRRPYNPRALQPPPSPPPLPPSSTCYSHHDCDAKSYCSRFYDQYTGHLAQQCYPCADAQGRSCSAWGDSIDGNCAVCFQPHYQDELPPPPPPPAPAVTDASCRSHDDCSAGSYCSRFHDQYTGTLVQQCYPCLDQRGRTCSMWGDSSDGSCDACAAPPPRGQPASSSSPAAGATTARRPPTRDRRESHQPQRRTVHDHPSATPSSSAPSTSPTGWRRQPRQPPPDHPQPPPQVGPTAGTSTTQAAAAAAATRTTQQRPPSGGGRKCGFNKVAFDDDDPEYSPLVVRTIFDPRDTVFGQTETWEESDVLCGRDQCGPQPQPRTPRRDRGRARRQGSGSGSGSLGEWLASGLREGGG
eukprot:COSAG01_NODE_2749_length_7147_cov_21.077185_6_plen_634_part_00